MSYEISNVHTTVCRVNKEHCCVFIRLGDNGKGKMSNPATPSASTLLRSTVSISTLSLKGLEQGFTSFTGPSHDFPEQLLRYYLFGNS